LRTVLSYIFLFSIENFDFCVIYKIDRFHHFKFNQTKYNQYHFM